MFCLVLELSLYVPYIDVFQSDAMLSVFWVRVIMLIKVIVFNVFMMSVIMVSVMMLSDIILSVMMLNVIILGVFV